MNFEAEIISTKKYLLKTIVSKILFIVAVLSLILVIDRSLEGGLLEVYNAPLYLYLIVWGWIIIAISLSIYFGSKKYKLGKMALISQGVQIALYSGNITELFSYGNMETLGVVLRTDVSGSKYSRGVLDGGRNVIEFIYQGRTYKYEFFLESVVQDKDLDATLKELPNYMSDSKLKIKRRRKL